jgi:hypothetical protein
MKKFISFTRLYIERYWILAFLKPALKRYDKKQAKKQRMPRIVLRMQPGNYELMLKLSSRLVNNLTDCHSFPVPPETLTALKQATDELKQAIYNWENPVPKKGRAA